LCGSPELSRECEPNNAMPMPGAFRAQFKYPLLGKVFYLDLPEAEASSLAPDIQKLGGRIEEAFNPKKLTHVVTNRALDSDSPLSPLEETRMKYSGGSRLRRMELMVSRSKQIRSFKGQDILQVAKKLRKRIVHLEKMRKYVSRRLSPSSGELAPRSGSPVSSAAMPNVSQGPLPIQGGNASAVVGMACSPPDAEAMSSLPALSPVKVFPRAPLQVLHGGEEAEQPQGRFAQAAKLPHSAVNPYLNPNASQFRSLGEGSKPERAGRTFSHSLVPMPQDMPFVRLDDTYQGFKPIVRVFEPVNGDPTTPQLNYEVPPPYTPFLSKTNGQKLRQLLEKRKVREGATRRGSTHRVVPKKGGFCECCRVRYENYTEHIRTAAHAAFEADDDNYRELDALMSE